ncbi:MAG: Na/Pi symporter [Waddliaceae bacterium]
MIAFSKFLAGLAFFLMGLRLFSANLNQLTGPGFRHLVVRFTRNNAMAGLSGIVLSLLTVGNAMITPLIAAGLQSVNAFTLHQSIYLIVWSRLGSCLFVYLAGFDIETLALFLVGVSGIVSALGKSRRFATFMMSIFALAMVLYGIQGIKDGAKVLLEMDWFTVVIAQALENPWIAFSAGWLFVVVSQSLFGALVLVLSAGIFNMQAALLFVYGAYLGETTIKAFCLAGFKHAFRQAMGVMVLFYLLAFLIGMLFFFLEEQFSLPQILVPYTHTNKVYLAHVNLGIHIIVVILLTLFAHKIESLLSGLSLGEKEDGELKVLSIPSEILDDPIITTDLISQEESRLLRQMPQYHDNLRSGKSLLRPSIQHRLHENLSKNFSIIRDAYRDLLNRSSYHQEISAHILEGIERQNLLTSLESNLYELSEVTDQFRLSFGSHKELAQRVLNFIEAIDFLLLSLIGIMESPKPEEIKMLDILTREHEDFKKIARSLFGPELTLEQEVYLIREMHLFESSTWLIKKLAKFSIARVKQEAA